MHRKLISAVQARSLLPAEGGVHVAVPGICLMATDVSVNMIHEHIETHEVWLDLESAPMADHLLVILKDGYHLYIEVDQEKALSIWYSLEASDHLSRLRSNADGPLSYEQLYELIIRMPPERRCDAATVFDRKAGECRPIAGFGPIAQQDVSGGMVSQLTPGHAVITI